LFNRASQIHVQQERAKSKSPTVSLCSLFSRFLEVYSCSTYGRKCLLRLTIRDTVWRINMSTQKIAIGAVVAVAAMLMMTSALALLQSSRTFTSTGVITSVNVGVYQDVGCTQVLSSIDWGTLDPGATSNKTIYVKNSGNTQVSLNMTVSAWSPSNASNYITVTWNREGTVLNAGSSVTTLLTLSVSSSITGITNFSFNVTIVGTQV